MKSLKQFIQEEKEKYSHFHIKRINSIVAPQGFEWASEYTFEDYCNYNEIDVTDSTIDEQEYIWDKFINNRWVPFDFHVAGYDFQRFLLETEIEIMDSDEVYKRIDKEFGNYYNDVIYTDNGTSKYIYYELYGETEKLKILLNNKKFIQLMNRCNWYACPKYKDDDVNKEIEYILIKPNKTENKTKEVYSFPIIYHYCPKFIYEEKIKKYGLNPKHKFGSKYEKIYVFYTEKDPIFFSKRFANLKWESTDNKYKKEKINKEFVLLSIDLHKMKNNKITFYKDEESNSSYTFFTFEPIAPYCITNVQEFKVGSTKI